MCKWCEGSMIQSKQKEGGTAEQHEGSVRSEGGEGHAGAFGYGRSKGVGGSGRYEGYVCGFGQGGWCTRFGWRCGLRAFVGLERAGRDELAELSDVILCKQVMGLVGCVSWRSVCLQDQL
ncbi:hypothetical protein O6H91_05G034800 [Diphasiastrum complanatum]|uniref:Uncharacterized protein n=1 Tax=Diphasiastrum complanatum TaxID=34168 RepID=A0ACC2DMB5_DIPCM|nr:hypothetical protein O6H91_05G034800 [Diphasiastrum complanatum]